MTAILNVSGQIENATPLINMNLLEETILHNFILIQFETMEP